MDEATLKRMWAVYRDAFEPLRTLAAARQVLTWDEFQEEMLDDRVVKFLARTGDGTAWAMTTMTQDFTTIPWIEPAFYEHLYPGHAAAGTIFYNGFSAVHPEAQGSKAFRLVIGAMVAEVVAVDGVLCCDLCGHNRDVVGFLEGAVRRIPRPHVGECVAVDTQTYYAIEMRREELPGT